MPFDARLAATTRAAWDDLVRDGRAIGDGPPAAAMPCAFAATLERAFATGDAALTAQLERHYLDMMPRMRVAQLASTDEPAATLFHTPLVWDRLPRLAAAIDRLVALLAEAGVAPGTAVAPELRTAPTLAALYGRTHYGGCMPLLYGYPADLAYFARRGRELGLDTLGVIDRYLTAPLVHELCHFSRDRAALEPAHLDECVAGWLGVHVHRELAYPAPGHDDAIYAAPWLAQVGQAIARGFGIATVIRAHAGAAPWPAGFAAAAARLGRADWDARRTLHFLSDTFEPRPWVALALAAAAGRSIDTLSLAELAALPLGDLALAPDPDLDAAIARDALAAMCLDNGQVEGSFRTRLRFPAIVEVHATACAVSTPHRSAVDPVAPRYWLPPEVARRLGDRTLVIADADALATAAAAV